MSTRDRARSAGATPGGPAGLLIRDYTPQDDPEARALDRECTQGGALRLSFERATFRRRAENFRDWRILTARLDGILVGTVGGALKEVVLLGEPSRAAFLFDLRVHPTARQLGVARRLSEEILDWAFRSARLAYTYVVADNRITTHLAAVLDARRVADYDYLVYPTYRQRRPVRAVESVSFDAAHEAFLEANSPLDFYSHPDCRAGEGGYVGSWILRDARGAAGCSCWSNRGILGEVIQRVPLPVRLAGRALGLSALFGRRWPHVPRPGEELRSWYVFDFFATRADLARELMRHIEGEAVRRDIDYCYIVHLPGSDWMPAVRADVPGLFAPLVRYHLLARGVDGPAPDLPGLYVDIRDL